MLHRTIYAKQFPFFDQTKEPSIRKFSQYNNRNTDNSTEIPHLKNRHKYSTEWIMDLQIEHSTMQMFGRNKLFRNNLFTTNLPQR